MNFLKLAIFHLASFPRLHLATIYQRLKKIDDIFLFGVFFSLSGKDRFTKPLRRPSAIGDGQLRHLVN